MEPAVETCEKYDREGDRPRHPHDAGAELLVRQRRHTAGPSREERVRVVGRRREGQYGCQRPRLNGPQKDIRRPLEGAEANMKRVLVDDLGPEEDAKAEEEPVLEVVHGMVAEREVIGGGPVPEPEVDRGDDE